MDLKAELEHLDCRIIDVEEARATTHRDVLLILAQTFNRVGAVLLCEPSVVGGRARPPDIAVLDPVSGLHVIEVKGVGLDQVRSVQAGGAIEIAYDGRTSRKDPSRQARQAMFDVKDAASRHFNGELNIPFESWVAFPRIRRGDWEQKFGEAVSGRPDVLFCEDLESSHLGDRLRAPGIRRLAAFGLSECPPRQLQSVMAAFGDSEVLRPAPRPGPRPPEGSKGERLDEALAAYRVLTEQQQRLTAQSWSDGPRLVRGVAGSGKTVVLATQVARVVERLRKQPGDLFDRNRQIPAVLAVCFNRTLVPFIRERIEVAYRQRTQEDVPKGAVLVLHFNALLYELSRRGFCRYHRISEVPDPDRRAALCLADLKALNGVPAEQLSNGLFHGVFVDEGQDFHPNEYRVLLALCARTPAGLPRAFVFYDDAQNLYGLQRPTWAELGLDVRGGRSVVMDESFRSPRQVIEPAFNVLLGSHAADPLTVKTRGFADLQTLKDKNLISVGNGHVRIDFAAREGEPVALSLCKDREEEQARLADRCDALLGHDGLLPQDILILTFRRQCARQLANDIAARIGPDLVRCAFNETEKDRLALQPDRLTVSTIASAKGYDAPYVLLASLDDFPDDVEGRASLYVGCTRAREWLEVSGSSTSPLFREFEASLAATRRSSCREA